MANYDYVLKRGDRQSRFVSVLKDPNGNPVDLTGKTVKFIMRQVSADTAKVSAAATPDPDQAANTGRVTYDPAAADIDTADVYYVEWQTTQAGLTLTYPNGWHEIAKIVGDLGS